VGLERSKTFSRCSRSALTRHWYFLPLQLCVYSCSSRTGHSCGGGCRKGKSAELFSQESCCCLTRLLPGNGCYCFRFPYFPGRAQGHGAAGACNIKQSHRIIEWPGLKRTTVIIGFQPPAMCRVANQQTRLPRATSSLALSASRDGASTASLGNLFQCVTTLSWS